MPGQTILALVTAQIYGLLVALIVLPITLAGGLTVVFAGYFTWYLIVVPAALILLLFLVILVSSARLASALTGLAPIRRQGDLLAATARSGMPTVFGLLFLLLLSGCGVLIYAEIDGGRELWWYDSAKLEAARKVIAKDPAQEAVLLAIENLHLETVIYLVQGALLIVITGLAVFVLPRAIGLRGWYDRAYTTGLLALRFFIALPFFAAMTWIVGQIATAGFEAAMMMTPGEKVLFLIARSFVEAAIFAGMVMAFEAITVRDAAEEAAAVKAVIDELSRVDSDEYRALRESWTERGNG